MNLTDFPWKNGKVNRANHGIKAVKKNVKVIMSLLKM